MKEAGRQFGEIKWECPECQHIAYSGRKRRVYFCPSCLEPGYGTWIQKHYSFFGRKESESVQEIYCPSCNGDVVVAEIPEDLEKEIRTMHARTDAEAVASALLLLIAAGKIEAKRWILEDGKGAFVEFKPTVESILNDYTKDVILKGYNALGKLKTLVLPELI